MENNTTKEKFVRIIRKLVFGFSIGWGVLFGLILMVSKMGFLTNVFAYIIFGILPIMLAIIITEKISENVLKEKMTVKRKKVYFGLLGGMTLIILISGIGENKTETVKQNVVKTEDNTNKNNILDKNLTFEKKIIIECEKTEDFKQIEKFEKEYFPLKKDKEELKKVLIELLKLYEDEIEVNSSKKLTENKFWLEKIEDYELVEQIEVEIRSHYYELKTARKKRIINEVLAKEYKMKEIIKKDEIEKILSDNDYETLDIKDVNGFFNKKQYIYVSPKSNYKEKKELDTIEKNLSVDEIKNHPLNALSYGTTINYKTDVEGKIVNIYIRDENPLKIKKFEELNERVNKIEFWVNNYEKSKENIKKVAEDIAEKIFNEKEFMEYKTKIESAYKEEIKLIKKEKKLGFQSYFAQKFEINGISVYIGSPNNVLMIAFSSNKQENNNWYDWINK